MHRESDSASVNRSMEELHPLVNPPEHHENMENMMITHENYRVQKYKLSYYEIYIAV
jgi:hypothetical protein